MAVPRARYIGGDTVLHRLYPLSKLLVLALLCVSAFIFEMWYVAAALALLLVLLYLTRGIGIGRLLDVLKPLPPFIVLIVLAHIFFVGRSDPLWANVLKGLLQGLRIAVILAAASLFLAVTDPVDLSDSVLRAMRPLKRRGVRVGDLSLMVMIVFSFLPLIADEARRLRTAQAVRCGFHRRGLGMIKGIIPLLAPLVIGIFRRAEEMELSLAARCYNLERPRSSFTKSKIGRLDLVVCSASVLLFIFGLYAKLQAYN